MTEPAPTAPATEPDVDPNRIEALADSRDTPLTTDEDQQDGGLGGGGGEAGTG